MIEKYSNTIVETCRETIPEKKTKEILKLPWWNEELATLKRQVATKKRRIRCAALIRRNKVIDEYLQAKREYEDSERVAQTQSWKEFCQKQTKEGVWDGIYRVIGRTAIRQEDLPLTGKGGTCGPMESARLLADTFYPEDSTENDRPEHRRIREAAELVNVGTNDNALDPPFTMDELRGAAESFNPKKAPGCDGMTPDICQRAISASPEAYLALANKCLEIGHFPKIWKLATVVVLRKPGKDDYTHPKAYRPIGLLPVLGKILEKLIINRLKWYILPGLSTHQFGFVPQRSTEDALYVLMKHIKNKLTEKKLITIVSLDIEGAFDSAWWPLIRVRLAEEKCPVNLRKTMDSYLQDRRVCVRYAGAEYTKETTKGCVQGSIGGPILWNILLNPLLKRLEERGVYCQAFADDIILAFHGDSGLEISTQANATLAYVQEWGAISKLKFAPQKTKAMTVTNKLKYDTPLLRMGGTDIEMSTEIKVLGLTIDHRLTFNRHIDNVCRKVQAIYKQVSRAAKTSWGLHPEVIKIIYKMVVEPVVLYAASAWAPAAKKLGARKRLDAIQRGFCQKIIKAYRTVSLNSVLVLAGILPLDLRVQEAALLYEARRGIPLPEMGDREVERLSPFTKQPHPANRIAQEFVSLTDQDQLNSHNDQAVRIYTDGSKIEGKVGAALSVWSEEAETKALKLKLDPCCTVYQAELLAVSRATSLMVASSERTFGLYTDSRSSLDAVLGQRSFHPLVVEIRGNLEICHTQNKKISLFWVKAHAGLEGNERADELAKEAALNLKRKPDYDKCPVSFVKRHLRMRTLDEWNRRYKSGKTAKTTRLFYPDAIQAYRVTRGMEHTALQTQILTGHGGFSKYLHRFKCKEDPSCVCEPGVEESIEHVLFECPVTEKYRMEVEWETELRVTVENAPEFIASGGRRTETFLDYCRCAAARTIRRNKTDECR